MEIDITQAPAKIEKKDQSFAANFRLETLIIIFILTLTIVSRFVDLGQRVMSHDEVNHVVPSWDFYQGKIYRQDPISHGPLQFHLIAASYTLFGDNDFTSRIPSAVFSIFTVAVVLLGFKRYLGRVGSLIAGFLFSISPYILFYGRYTRNEALVGLIAVSMFYAVFRYLERRDALSLLLLSITTALNFTLKETAYFYAAQLLLFLAFMFLTRISKADWKTVSQRSLFLLFMGLAIFSLLLTLGFAVIGAGEVPLEDAEVSGLAQPMENDLSNIGLIISLGSTVLFGISAGYFLLVGLGLAGIRNERSFDLLILLGTLVLPLLSAFPMKLAGWTYKAHYETTQEILVLWIAPIILFAISIAIGLWWRSKTWMINAVAFYAIFFLFYTSFFTNSWGVISGLIGSLGYWLEQQGVERGSQPWYYYGLIQIPLYEFLPAMGSVIAIIFGIKKKWFSTHIPQLSNKQILEAELWSNNTVEEFDDIPQQALEEGLVVLKKPMGALQGVPVLAFLLFWSFTSLVAYSVAGEKMPWLTFHIAIPLILTAGWGIARLIEYIEWKKIFSIRGVLILILLPIFFTSFSAVAGTLINGQLSFSSESVEGLAAISNFSFGLIGTILSSIALIVLMGRDWQLKEIASFLTSVLLAFLVFLTGRTAYRAAYLHYDYPLEYLVYAHAGRGPKDILEQVEDISYRLTGGLDIEVAYDNDGLYPYWWYFRNYPNKKFFADTPTRELRDAPIILAGVDSFGKIQPVVRENYHEFEYTRMWWPNQDYYDLTWERLWNAVSNPQMRTAIMKIWLNKDYSDYAQITGNQNLTLQNWSPGEKIRMYIRKDVASMIWDHGNLESVPIEIEEDLYEEGMVSLPPDIVIGSGEDLPGTFQSPRGITVGPDGSIYVADSLNHQIQHFDQNGNFLNAWGSLADSSKEVAPGGTFNEPWGVEAAADGSVYVADTWNHRIQKFDSDGSFLMMWGQFGQVGDNYGFWGPRDIALDEDGRVYVTDTGNKRIMVYSSNGEYVTEFGSGGMDFGQLDEPVGLAIDLEGNVFVADTWNQRIQVFERSSEGFSFFYSRDWEVQAWYGQTLENKPFIAVDSNGIVAITDPEGSRVIQFNPSGTFLRGWGDYSIGTNGFGVASGISYDANGDVWVIDSENNRVLHFPIID
ncbi:MAG: glycosyltransferase family 39 protein [Anaerolineaceae bacterium]|nr:glycosyltransferase family 39 protein [Anaerolineaceae bacterium]